MANNVFANGREVSCKSGDGKSICAFPDVCFTPPENPFTPPGVPIPYPNTGMAGDTTSGSKKVKISGKEVMLKNKSYFKKSIGDEAGCASKKGVVTSVNCGKVYFISWSMDVKFEGENVVRHLDMTTHNHASPMTNTPPWVHTDELATIELSKCEKSLNEIKTACKPKSKAKCPDMTVYNNAKEKCEMEYNHLWNNHLEIPTNSPEWTKIKEGKEGDKYREALKKKEKAIESYSKKIKKNDCLKKLRCNLVPKKKGGKNPCCAPQSAHHIIPVSQFKKPDIEGYDENAAPCICVEGQNQHQATHGWLHWRTAVETKKKAGDPLKEQWPYTTAEDIGSKIVAEEADCDKECIKAQVRKMHEKMVSDITEKNIKPTAPGPTSQPMANNPF